MLKKLRRYLSVLVVTCLCWVNPLHAVIVSGYRVKIGNLGKLILLGDVHKRTEYDVDQYHVIRSYLRTMSELEPQKLVFNIEMTRDTHVLYQQRKKHLVGERLPVTQVLTKARVLVSSLKEEEGLQGIQFTASDPRNSEIWDIVRVHDLRELVKEALLNKGTSLRAMSSFASLAVDHKKIMERYKRFLIRAEKHLPIDLNKAIVSVLKPQVHKALESIDDRLRSVFSKYVPASLFVSGWDSFKGTTIHQVIFRYAYKEFGEKVKNFLRLSQDTQKDLVDTVTKKFYEDVGKQFREEYYLPMANLPWLIDCFNAFLSPRNATTAIIYAGDSHIDQIMFFLKKVQKALEKESAHSVFGKTVSSFDWEKVMVDTGHHLPLEKKALKKVFDLEGAQVKLLEKLRLENRKLLQRKYQRLKLH